MGTEISLSTADLRPAEGHRSEEPRPADARFVLERAIAQYDRAGVGADAATRAKIKMLQDRISETSIAFERNIADGRKEVTATAGRARGTAGRLYRRPQARRPDGLVRISTDYPDLGPVLSYAENEGLRRRLYEANLTRAYPANDALLRKVFADRAELARLLGRPNYATLITEDKMIGSPANATRFLDEIATVVDDSGAARPQPDADPSEGDRSGGDGGTGLEHRLSLAADPQGGICGRPAGGPPIFRLRQCPRRNPPADPGSVQGRDPQMGHPALGAGSRGL
jgi:hypothetical protein